MKTLLLALSSVLVLGGVASAETPAPSAEDTLLQGLVEIRDNKWDDFVSKRCSKSALCMTDNSIRSLKVYNLPAMQRRSKSCINAAGKIKITRTDEISATERKLFVQCGETSMPYPFRMGLENGHWHFLSL